MKEKKKNQHHRKKKIGIWDTVKRSVPRVPREVENGAETLSEDN